MNRYICEACNWVGNESELLTAQNPFDIDSEIAGCPACKSINTLIRACDEPGCNRTATCGWPSPSGYRATCAQHYKPVAAGKEKA
jgi:hypothetical protein